MKNERHIRKLYPPIYLLAALCTAAYFDPNLQGDIENTLADNAFGWEKLVGIVAAGGVLVIVAGFLIGTVSIVLLRLIFFLFSGFRVRSHEAFLDAECLIRISKQLNWSDKAFKSEDPKWALFAAATFDHELLSKPIHEWLLRRWSTFNICASTSISLSALMILTYTGLIPIVPHQYWYYSVEVISLFFGIQAVFCFKDTMGMFKYQSYRKLPAPLRLEPLSIDTKCKGDLGASKETENVDAGSQS